jgi:hypothetical protein
MTTLAVKVDCLKGKAVSICGTYDDVVEAVKRLSTAYPHEPIQVTLNAHARNCECAHCVTTIIEDGKEISRWHT